MMPNQGPSWLMPRQKPSSSEESEEKSERFVAAPGMTYASAIWVLEAVAFLHLASIWGAFEGRSVLGLLAIAKAVIVLAYSISIGEKHPRAWAAAVVVPALYLAVSGFLFVWMVTSLFSGPLRGNAIGFPALWMFAIHSRFLFVMAKSAWDNAHQFQIPIYQRRRALVRMGLPVAVAFLAVDVILATSLQLR